MNEPAVISADYTDLRFVKGRKVCQIVVEIPIEHAGAFVEAFGTPQPDRSVPVALARLEPQKANGTAKADIPYRRADPKHRRSREAAMRCGEVTFWRFLEQESGEERIDDADHAAAVLRNLCEVNSRSEFDVEGSVGAQRWQGLEGRYQAWLRV